MRKGNKLSRSKKYSSLVADVSSKRVTFLMPSHILFLACRNYVVQALLQLGEAQSSVSVCQALKRQLEELSMDQRGSYVVQEALRSAGGMILMAELARFEKDRLETLATDRYGNYILQTAVKESKVIFHFKLTLLM